jgi:flagellin FlaB
MRKIIKMLKKKDVGAVGIGAMIVFIAMVLVAGIAASVLIQTATRLESQAMKTGQDTIAEVSTGIAVFDVTGKKNASDLGLLAITIRPRAGAADVDLNETVILISDGTTKSLLQYYGYRNASLYNASVDADGDLFGTGGYGYHRGAGSVNNDGFDLCSMEYFGIIVLEDADSSCLRMSPVINKGDKVVLTFKCDAADGLFDREIPERTDVIGKVIPEVGSPGIIAFTTPASYTDTIMDLQ